MGQICPKSFVPEKIRDKKTTIFVLGFSQIKQLAKMTILPKFHMRPCKKKVSWRRRHHASTALTRILSCRFKNIVQILCKGMEICKTKHRRKLKKIIAMLLIDYDALTCVEPEWEKQRSCWRVGYEHGRGSVKMM